MKSCCLWLENNAYEGSLSVQLLCGFACWVLWISVPFVPVLLTEELKLELAQTSRFQVLVLSHDEKHWYNKVTYK